MADAAGYSLIFAKATMSKGSPVSVSRLESREGRRQRQQTNKVVQIFRGIAQSG